MKRADLIRLIEQGGCVLVRHGGNTSGTAIRLQVSRSQFPGIVKLRNRSIKLLSFRTLLI